jgi:hypothetical protein
MRIAFIAFLVVFNFLWAGTQVHARQVGVAFEFAATEESVELTNSYEDLVTLSLSAPKNGYIVLTGSGYLTLTTDIATIGTVWAWANISIGTISGASNNENETAVELPFAEGGGYTYRYPFSITTVIPVKRGTNNFYMVGIRDPNTDFSRWSASNLKLTAIFIKKRL